MTHFTCLYERTERDSTSHVCILSAFVNCKVDITFHIYATSPGGLPQLSEFVILFWFLAPSAQTMWMVGRKCPTTFDTCRVGTHTFIYMAHIIITHFSSGVCLSVEQTPIFVASLNFLKNLFWGFFYRVVSVWQKWTVRNSSFDVNTAIINSLQNPNLEAKIFPQDLNVKVLDGIVLSRTRLRELVWMVHGQVSCENMIECIGVSI